MHPAQEILVCGDWPPPLRGRRCWRVVAVSCGCSAAFNAAVLALGYWLLLPAAEPGTLMLTVQRGPASVESAPRAIVRPAEVPLPPELDESRVAPSSQVPPPPLLAPEPTPSQAAVDRSLQAVHGRPHREDAALPLHAGNVHLPPEKVPQRPADVRLTRRAPAVAPHVASQTATHLARRETRHIELPGLAAHEVPVAAPASLASRGAEVDTPPRPVFNPAPAYPPDALAARATGLVELRVRVAADGRVLAAALHRSSGHASLDRAALEAVRQWRFQPAQRDATAVEHEVIVPIRFRLRQ